MEIVWNPRRVLEVDPYGSFTCVGKAKTGKRCRQSFFSNSDLTIASNLLDRMAASDPRNARTHLRPLAEVTLCPRWHRKPGYSQVESVIRQWWSTIISYVQLQSISTPISNPVPLPRNRARVSHSSETASASRRLLTPDSSPPSRIIAHSPLQENARQDLTSTGYTSAGLSLATPPPSPPSPELAPRSLLGSTEQAVDSHESNLATLSLLTPPTSPPSPTPAPRLPHRSNALALMSTMSTASTFASLSFSTPAASPPSPTPAPRLRRENTERAVDSHESNLATLSLLTPPTSPPSPTQAPRLLRRSIRQSTISDEQVSESLNLPELPSLPLPVNISIPEVTQTSDSIEPPSAILILSTAPIPSTAPMERPLPPLPADIERLTSLADTTAITPPQASLVSPARSSASPNRSASSRARSTVTVMPTTTSPQLPRQTPPVDDDNSTNTPLPNTMPTATALSSQTLPSTPRAPRRAPFSSTWQQLILESPVQQPSPSPCSYSKQLIPTSCPEETKSVDGDSVSCLATCSGRNILDDCSALWRKVSLGTRKAITTYVCCSP